MATLESDDDGEGVNELRLALRDGDELTVDLPDPFRPEEAEGKKGPVYVWMATVPGIDPAAADRRCVLVGTGSLKREVDRCAAMTPRRPLRLRISRSGEGMDTRYSAVVVA